MKKLLGLVLCIGLVFVVVGCSSNSDAPDKKAEKKETSSNVKQKLEILEHGYSMVSENNYLNYGVTIKNPNKKYYVEFPTITITAYAEDGSILSNEEQVLFEIAPSETLAYAGTVDTKGSIPSKVEFKTRFQEEKYQNNPNGIESKNFEISNTNEIIGDYDSVSYTGQIKNNSKKDCKQVAIVVLLKNNDAIVGGEVTFVDSIPSGESAAFETLSSEPISHTSYEFHALTW